MSPAAAAELPGLDKPACPQPRCWSPGCSRAGKGEVTGIQIPQGQEQQQEQRCWLSWELREALGSSRHGPGTNPARGAPAGPKFLGMALRAPGKAPREQKEQQSWRCCCCSPFTVTFPKSSRACLGSALPSSPCSKGQCPSALDQRWKQLQAPALMKPALESLSLGKGGVIQHKQL